MHQLRGYEMSIQTASTCQKVEIALNSMGIRPIHALNHEGVRVTKPSETGQVGVVCNISSRQTATEIADDIADELHAYGFKVERSITARWILLVS